MGEQNAGEKRSKRMPRRLRERSLNNARFRRTPSSASGFVVASPTPSWIAAIAKSRRFGHRAASAAARAAGISSRVKSVQ